MADLHGEEHEKSERLEEERWWAVERQRRRAETIAADVVMEVPTICVLPDARCILLGVYGLKKGQRRLPRRAVIATRPAARTPQSQGPTR